MGFAETGLSVEGGCEDGGDGAEKLPVDRHDLGCPSDGNVHNSLEKMPMQSVSFLELRRPMLVSMGYLVGRIGVEVPGLGILPGGCGEVERGETFLGILSTLMSPRMLDR